jgi:putative cardiolipin synthase
MFFYRKLVPLEALTEKVMLIGKSIISFFIGTALILGGCATLKVPPSVEDVYSMAPAAKGDLAQAAGQFGEKYTQGESGFLIISRNKEAFEWRLALIDEAVQSIDAQYFIWQKDETGTLLFDRLLKAADRGVRVRLLVDDMVFAGKDRNIAAIARHPNFDIKIFNPGNVRNSLFGLTAASDFLLNFKQLNRRMHNKLMVVDNQFAIVGGRNIGNAYFGLSKKYNFRDLGLLVTGPVLLELSAAFDLYWNIDLAYPAGALSDEATLEDLEPIRREVETYLSERKKILASYPLEPIDWQDRFSHLADKLSPGKAYFLQDKPVRIGEEEYRLWDMLDHIAGPTKHEITIVTPYFIPTKDFGKNLTEINNKDVKISLVTASMGANNHTAAHSHYKKYRRDILATGAELFEVKHDLPADMKEISDVPPVQSKFISLHIKALVADRVRCFVGSLNMDPRALVLNTENGLYIESPELCGDLADQFDTLMDPDIAWHVYVDADNYLQWESSTGTVSVQPARSFGQRIADFFFRLLPLESQL